MKEIEKNMKKIKEHKQELIKESVNAEEWSVVVKRGSSLEGRQKLIWSLYTLIPPRRSEDYIGLKITDTKLVSKLDKNINYILIQPKKAYKLILHKYKTSDSIGKVVLKVPKELKKVIDENIEEVEKITMNDLKKVLKQTKTTIRELRHSFVTEFLKDTDTTKLKKMEKQLGHSVTTMIHHYQNANNEDS
jgi:hypothetical protein